MIKIVFYNEKQGMYTQTCVVKEYDFSDVELIKARTVKITFSFRYTQRIAHILCKTRSVAAEILLIIVNWLYTGKPFILDEGREYESSSQFELDAARAE